VEPIDERDQSGQRQMLGGRHPDGQSLRVDSQSASGLVVREPEQSPVRHVQSEPDASPVRATRHELAKKRDVRVVVPEDPLVERLLSRPGASGNGSRDG
jgi:hypothetical protein